MHRPVDSNAIRVLTVTKHDGVDDMMDHIRSALRVQGASTVLLLIAEVYNAEPLDGLLLILRSECFGSIMEYIVTGEVAQLVLPVDTEN